LNSNRMPKNGCGCFGGGGAGASAPEDLGPYTQLQPTSTEEGGEFTGTNGMKAVSVPVNPNADPVFKHGEFCYSDQGQTIKFLLVPSAKTWDTNKILEIVLNPDLWGLVEPRLTVQPIGPHGYWPAAVEEVHDASNKQRWGKDEQERRLHFMQQVDHLGSGVLQAVVESGGWMYSTLASYNSHDHAGSVFGGAVDKFRNERPSSELVYLCGRLNTQFYAGQDTSQFDPARPFRMHYPHAIDLEEFAVPFGESVTQRLMLPGSMRSAVWALGADGKPEAGPAELVLPHYVSHMVIFDTMSALVATDAKPSLEASRPDRHLEALLTTSFPHAAVFIGGISKARTMQYSCDLANRGCFVIALENTGKWVDLLCRAVRHHRESKSAKAAAATSATKANNAKEELASNESSPDDSMHDLPPDLDDRKYLLFDALTETSEKVVTRLTKILTKVPEGEISELGFAATDKARVKEAWQLYAKLRYNANIQKGYAFLLHGFFNLVSVFTTLAVALYDNKNLSAVHVYLAGACIVLPIFSSFLQSLMGAFSPVNKFSLLAMGAEQLKSTIYRYRARVAEFSPNRQQSDVLTKLKLASRAASGKGVKSRVQGNQAQANFAKITEAICDQAFSDMKQSSISLPGLADMKTIREAQLPHSDLEMGAKRSIKGTPHSLFDELLDEQEHGHDSETFLFLGQVEREESFTHDDDLGSLLTARDYLLFRTIPLKAKYRQRAVFLERKVRQLQVFMFLCTFVAGLLSYFHLKPWVPTVIALASGASSWLEFSRLQTRLSNCNQARQQLDNLQRWWASLSLLLQRTQECKESLVELTEQHADAEESVWAKAVQCKLTAKEKGEAD